MSVLRVTPLLVELKNLWSKTPESLSTNKPEDPYSGRRGFLALRGDPGNVLPLGWRIVGQDVRGWHLSPMPSQAQPPEAAQGHDGWKQSHHLLCQWQITRWNSLLYAFRSYHEEKCKILIRLQNKWNWFMVYNYRVHLVYRCISHFWLLHFVFPLGQEYTNSFCKGIGSKYFRLCVSHESA